MNRGILFASLTAFACSGLASACRTPASEAQQRTVDGMITRVDAAMLTLNELDKGRYSRAAALFRSENPRFIQRFNDTLDRATAERLGNHFNVLRASGDMGQDHDLVLVELGRTSERLRALRQDMTNRAIGSDEVEGFLRTEAQRMDGLDGMVAQVIANYRSVQGAWDDLGAIDSLLAVLQHNTTSR
jgi:hypothetical protein